MSSMMLLWGLYDFSWLVLAAIVLSRQNLCLFVDPVKVGLLPAGDLALAEPEVNLLLSAVDGVAAVADDLRWEVSRGGARFPHLYRALIAADVTSARAL